MNRMLMLNSVESSEEDNAVKFFATSSANVSLGMIMVAITDTLPAFTLSCTFATLVVPVAFTIAYFKLFSWNVSTDSSIVNVRIRTGWYSPPGNRGGSDGGGNRGGNRGGNENAGGGGGDNIEGGE